MVPAGGEIGAARMGVHCEPRGLVSRTPVSPTKGRMSTITMFCIGTVPTFCTRSWYWMAPPISVPLELVVKPPPSHRPSTFLLDTSWPIGATLAVPVAVQRVSPVSPSPSRSWLSVCDEPEQRSPRPGLFEAMLKVFESGPKTAPDRTVVLKRMKTCWFTPRLPLPAFQRQRSSRRPLPWKLGICSKVWGAGRPVPWSSNDQLPEKTRFTGRRSIATSPASGAGSLDCGALRTRSRQLTVCPGLKGPPPERLSFAGLSCTKGPLRVKVEQVVLLTLVRPAV